ncbi:regulatory protein [Intrasporangium chromatireducens Q5-1]|uniref:Regulatory protein n=1 Tax=Intrasporangium chromatireducens Q5-1 TaxID=584657 RepID=W9GRA8_9MICO|nr:PucR family transcriptional regulator [Intrasporangium chromatireducens]EWT06419.1 regulatory protein [Intrasporangium chromatireducens Q5-1]
MPGSTSHLTIEDLVANESLGLAVVVPGDLETRVRGAHTMEIDNPARWLEPGWLMLTTGLRFVGNSDPAVQVRLVEELRAARVAGLAFGVDVHFPQVPPMLVEAAQEHQLTLLTVAAEVPFLQVESFVNRSLASAETYLVKRALWLQTDLLSALGSDQPLTTLVSRIGAIIKGMAIVYDEAGAVVTSTGAGPARLVWAEIRAREPRRQRFTVGRWHVATRPTVLGGMGYWIAIGSFRESVLDDLAEPILDSAQRLLAAIRGASALQATQARTEAAELLTRLRGVVEPNEIPSLWDRLGQFRFRPQAPLRAFVSARLPHAGADSGINEGLLDELAQEAQSQGLPIIFRPREADDVVGLVGLGADSAALLEWAEGLAGPHHVGVSEPFTDLGLARRSFRDARRASLVAQRRTNQRAPFRTRSTAGPRTTGMVVRFEDVDLATWLMSSRSSQAIHDKTQQQLGDLLDRPDLADTAVAYLATGLDIQRTALRLFLHPNSVRYRLRRIEEIVEAPITSPSVLANLYLAFHDRLADEDSRDEPAPDGLQ